MPDLTHHPQCSSVGGDACDCLGRVIPTERPLDLARCRALCDEAQAFTTLSGTPRRFTSWGGCIDELATALRAACDEVERLREQRERLRSHLAFPRRALQEQHEATDPLKAELAEARALLTAARAEGATAERVRLAGMASEEDRAMVEALMEAVRDEMESHYDPHEERTTLLARLAAARGEALEEAAGTECDDCAKGYPARKSVLGQWRHTVPTGETICRAGHIRALLAAPTKGGWVMRTPDSYLLERGRLVRHRRITIGLTQQFLADVLHLHREAITEVEAGRRDLSLFEAALLAPTLGVSLDTLVGDPLLGASLDSGHRMMREVR